MEGKMSKGYWGQEKQVEEKKGLVGAVGEEARRGLCGSAAFPSAQGRDSCEGKEPKKALLSVAKNTLAALGWVLGLLCTQVKHGIASISPLGAYQLPSYPDHKKALTSGNCWAVFLLPSLLAALHHRGHLLHGLRCVRCQSLNWPPLKLPLSSSSPLCS